MLPPEIIVVPTSEYCLRVTELVAEQMNQAVDRSRSGSMMLTGGRTAKMLYCFWAENHLLYYDNIRYYFGDERCVPPDDVESNYGMSMSAFLHGVPDGCIIERLIGEADHCGLEAERYASLLPSSVDILLLSVGEDGHIASLFPGSDALMETTKAVIPVTSPKFPYERFTITPKVIQSARSIFLFATGESKGMVLANALCQQKEHMLYPVLLAAGGSWIVDEQAAMPLQKHSLL